jgi:hypothetical protein
LQRQALELAVEKNRKELENFRHSEALKTAVSQAIRAIGQVAYSESAIISLLNQGADGVTVENTPDGPQPKIGGQTVSWPAAMQFFYASHEQFFQTDPKTLVAAEAAKRDEVLAKEDFRSLQHRQNFIAKHGLEEFENLPLSRSSIVGNRDPRRLSWPEYQKLSFSEKQRVVAEVGESGILKIMARK